MQLKRIQERSDPLKIAIRTKKLEVLDKAMASSDEIRIKYAAKQSSTSNSWKKWKGEIRGLKKLNAIEKKKAIELEFDKKVNENTDKKNRYIGLLEAMKEENEKLEAPSLARDYFVETSYWGVDMLNYVSRFRTLIKKSLKGKELDTAAVKDLMERTENHFKNYDLATDRSVFSALMGMYNTSSKGPYRPEIFDSLITGVYKGDFPAFTEALYSNSAFVSEEAMKSKLANWNKETAQELSNDLAFVFTKGIYSNYTDNIRPAIQCHQFNAGQFKKSLYRGLTNCFCLTINHIIRMPTAH